jgi:HlyD family secretion protein
MHPENPSPSQDGAPAPLSPSPATPQSLMAPAASGRGRLSLRFLLLLGVLAVPIVAGGIGFAMKEREPSNGHGHGNGHGLDQGRVAAIPVNTIRPRRKTLERTLEQPGSIQPWAQAELFAKASGYLMMIQHETTPSLAAELAALGGVGIHGPLARAARLAVAAELAWWQAPEIDIGSFVRRGDLLMEVATPERVQAIVEKATLVQQRAAELETARTGLGTFEAAIKSYEAQKVEAQADVRRFASEYALRTKEHERLKELARSRSVDQRLADEKEHQVSVALAAWESSQAKVLTAQAELAVVASKLTTARADLKVKETLVQVARDELALAHLLADYSRVYAPFDGIVTQRGVDEGDFVQNATSGQSRRLMTVTSLDKVTAVIQVPDNDAPWIQVGTEATLAIAAHKVRHGRISRIAHTLDPQTRTMQAEIDLDNRDRALLPGMYGKVIVTLQKMPDAQAIPATAVYSRKGQNFILQVKGGIASRQQVRIRYDDGKEMEVAKIVGDREVPLDGTEELIVSNKGEIADGQRVKTSRLHSVLTGPAPGGRTSRLDAASLCGLSDLASVVPSARCVPASGLASPQSCDSTLAAAGRRPRSQTPTRHSCRT